MGPFILACDATTYYLIVEMQLDSECITCNRTLLP